MPTLTLAVRSVRDNAGRFALGTLAIAVSVAFVVAGTEATQALVASIGGEDRDVELQDLGPLLNLLLALMAVVLVAATFVIANSFAAVGAARRREIALLRLLGARTAQVRFAAFVEAVIVGGAGIIVGLSVGALTGWAVGELLGVPKWPSARLLVVATVLGFIVTVLSAWVPARSAANVPPIEALRGAALAPVEPVPATRAALAIPLVVLLVLAIQVPLAGAIFGGLFGFLVLVVLGPWISTKLAVVLVRGSSPTAQLARGNITRNPRRSARTASALMLGVALATAGTAMATLLGNINEFEARYRVAVVAPTITEELVSAVSAVPGVESFTAQSGSFAEVGVAAQANVNAVREQVETAVSAFPEARLATGADFAERNKFATALGWGLGLMSAMALVVGIIGVVNAVVLGVWERRQELAVLRAVGFTRGQLRGLVLREALGLSLIGVAFGVGLSAVTIYGVLGLGSVLFIPFISWWLIALINLGIIAVAVIAALWPAHDAAATAPARALATAE